jgi:hydroxymethylpyrimidine pyrophosphatase-like HAD family hydrolase
VNDQRRFDLVVCDIDGCLTPEKPSPFDAEALARIAEYNRVAEERRDRPAITVCTGRPQPYAESICRLLGNMAVPCVAENGVWLYHPGTNDYRMDPAITEGHLGAVHEAEQWMRQHLATDGFTIQPGKSASVSLYHPDRERLLAFVPRVEDICREKGWPFRVSTTWSYINIDLTHVSKATGIARLLEATGLSCERIAGIGDTQGDAFIADAVAYFACPANAEDAIRKRADYVSGQAEAGGVLDILERLRG